MDNTRRKISVEEGLWRRMRARAAEQGITVSELVVNAVTIALDPPSKAAPASGSEPHINAIAAGTGAPGRGVRPVGR